MTKKQQKKNLVATWIASQTTCGEPVGVALAVLNEELGAKYSLSRLGEWRNGKVDIPTHVQRYMLENCLYHAVTRAGFTRPDDDSDATYAQLAEALLPPDRAKIQSTEEK